MTVDPQQPRRLLLVAAGPMPTIHSIDCNIITEPRSEAVLQLHAVVRAELERIRAPLLVLAERVHRRPWHARDPSSAAGWKRALRSWRALRPETFKSTKLPKTPPGALTARRGRRWHTLLGQKGSVYHPQ